jgi:hypothetical protein
VLPPGDFGEAQDPGGQRRIPDAQPFEAEFLHDHARFRSVSGRSGERATRSRRELVHGGDRPAGAVLVPVVAEDPRAPALECDNRPVEADPLRDGGRLVLHLLTGVAGAIVGRTGQPAQPGLPVVRYQPSRPCRDRGSGRIVMSWEGWPLGRTYDDGQWEVSTVGKATNAAARMVTLHEIMMYSRTALTGYNAVSANWNAASVAGMGADAIPATA